MDSRSELWAHARGRSRRQLLSKRPDREHEARWCMVVSAPPIERGTYTSLNLFEGGVIAMNITQTSPRATEIPRVDWATAGRAGDQTVLVGARPLNRIRTVRAQQGISLRTVARGRHVPLRQVRREESPHSDLRLSTLYDWQQFLEVPVADLLVECEDPLSRPVMERARMVKFMKTIATIRERVKSPVIKRLAQRLFDDAVEMMPELVDVQPWQRVGQRRTLTEYGRAAENPLSDEFFKQFDG